MTPGDRFFGALPALACVTLAAACLAPALLPATNYSEEGKRWWTHVEYLAGDALQGRDTGSPGHRKAAEYVAGEFERAHLKPAGTSGYFQPVQFRVREIDETRSSLTLVRPDGPQTLKLGEDANFGLRGDPAGHVEAPAVFVGYGLQVPEMKYDDLAGVDLKGKVAVLLYGAPAFIPGPLAAHIQSTERWKRLKAAGAVGIASFSDPRHTDVPWARSTLNRLHPAMSLTEPALNAESAGLQLSVQINPAHADLWLAGTGHTAEEIMNLAEAGKPLPKFPLHVKVRAEMALRTSEATSDNVAAVLEGSDPALRNEYVVVSAHLDHVGVGGEINGDRIYNGAMDNASGTASLLEIARTMAAAKTRPKRSVLFVAVTAEEKGLLGSKFFANHPTVKPEQIVANVNLDMFLPIVPLRALVVYGLDESDLGEMARQTGSAMNIGIVGDREPKRNIFVRSDQYNFIRRGVPALSFKFDAEPGSPEEKVMKEWIRVRYHAPSDDLAQPVDREAAARFNEYIERLTAEIADRPQRPAWKPSSFFRRFAQTSRSGS